MKKVESLRTTGWIGTMGFVVSVGSMVSRGSMLLAFAFVFGLFPSRASASNAGTIVVRISKPYCLFNFLETSVRARSTSPTLRACITSAVGTDSVFTAITEEFKALVLDYQYEREEFPFTRLRQCSTRDALIAALVTCDSLREISAAAVALLPQGEMRKLIEVMQRAEPYYDRAIWNECLPKLRSRQRALSGYADASDGMFRTIRSFYRSEWSDDVPFYVSLYPIPGASGHTLATPHVNTLCVAVLADADDDVGTMGVVYHEMCHVLYREQAKDFQFTLESWFDAHASPHARHARNFFDEAVATALGNGWAYRELRGSVDSAEWYSDEYINAYAKGIFAMVDDYIVRRRAMDAEFVDGCVAAFARCFPRANTEYDVLLNNIHVFSNTQTQEDADAIMAMVSRYFKLSSVSMWSPITDPARLRMMDTLPATQLIVVHRDRSATFAALRKTFAVLRSVNLNALPGEAVMSFVDKGRTVIIIVARRLDDIAKPLERMAERRFIDEASIIQK